jgi:TRAP-type transport system periplasmic protein
MGLPTEGQLDKYDRAFGAVMLPFIFDNRALVFRVLDGPAMAWLAPLAEKQGFVLLRNWDYGFRNVTNSVRPIHAPEDVKGLKLRTPPELQIQASMEALGAIVQAIAFPELYLALAQKVVDGEENPIAVIYYNKFYEVQKHLAMTRHIYNNMIHTVGVHAWMKLTPEQQTIFREESAAAGDLMRKLMAEGEADQIKKLKAAGMQITEPDLAPFRALMEPAYKRIADYAGADNVKKFRDMVDQARKA